MKNGSLSTKLLLAAIFATVLIYFGINMAAYFMDPYTTTTAYSYVSENAVTVSGYVVRQEAPLEGGGELVYFSRSEGEKVARGGTVALVYDNQQALEDANTLRSLNEQMDQLLYARSLAAGTRTEMWLEDEVVSSLVAFHQHTAADPVSAVDVGSDLRSAILKRSYAYTGTAQLDASIASLQTRIDTLTASSGASTSRITAPAAGLFSGLVDGYETVLTPEILETMTAADYRSLQPTSASGSGKMIYGAQWYFAALMRTADMGRIGVGDEVTLRFQSGLDRDLTMTVQRISDEDNGQRLVVLTSRQHLNLTTLLRQQNAQIIFDSFSGIRVPRSAVRILWEDVTDKDGKLVLRSDGTPEQTQITGVYSLWGNSARWKPVEILWQEDEYMLVTAADGVEASRRLRPGDQVITAAEDLYDGKVVE